MPREFIAEMPHADFSAVAHLDKDVRLTFLRKTYAHLFIALLAYMGLVYQFLLSPTLQKLSITMLSGTNFIITLFLFIGVSYVAERWARSSTSKELQYLGLTLYVVLMAFISMPLILFALLKSGPQVIMLAGITTLGIFGALTLITFISQKDFSFLGSLLNMGYLLALALIVISFFAHFTLGVVFMGFMVALLMGSILYETSNMLYYYHPDQYVAAALSLFASVVLLFWYVLRLFLSRE